MIKEVVSLELPVDEREVIAKNRQQPPSPRGDEKRICIISGIHGDELEGQYVCFRLNRIIAEHPEFLTGIVDIYPALNPLGVDTIQRGIPLFDLDMNRIFPGNPGGAVPEIIARRVIEDIRGADMAIDIHASNIFLREIPQVRINEITADRLIPYAELVGVDLVWVHQAVTVLKSTIAYSLNEINVPTLVVEAGIGMRLTVEFGDRLVNGILNLMRHLGIWQGPVAPVTRPIISRDGRVGFVNAEAGGVFIPSVPHWSDVKAGEKIGDVVNPLSGDILWEARSPVTGRIFTLREYPVVNPGSLLARILEMN